MQSCKRRCCGRTASDHQLGFCGKEITFIPWEDSYHPKIFQNDENENHIIIQVGGTKPPSDSEKTSPKINLGYL